MELNNDALIIMLPGLDGESDQYNMYINKLSQYNIKCIVPEIANKGNDLLKICGESVYNNINDIITSLVSFTDLIIPVFIIGYSNGGRIALYLYAKLMEKYERELGDRIYVATVAAPIKGTMMANIALTLQLYLSKINTYPNALDALLELQYTSETSMTILNQCLRYDNFKTHTKFFAAVNDIAIQPINCATVDECDKANCVINDITIGHHNILNYCCDDILKWIISIIVP
jgi:surfactin synthase thioesterase subunit